MTAPVLVGLGVDTVSYSYDLRALADPYDAGNGHTLMDSAWVAMKNKHGSLGPVAWQRWQHEATGLEVVVKGTRGRPYLLWEGSVAKATGVQGAAPIDTVKIWDRYLRSVFPYVPNAKIRRLDVCADFKDGSGLLRVAAANGYAPHARARYVQAVYQDFETVSQGNKSRLIRVYDKYAESGEEWARDVTRVEYQMRSAWTKKLGLSHVHGRFEEFAIEALDSVTVPLLERLAG